MTFGEYVETGFFTLPIRYPATFGAILLGIVGIIHLNIIVIAVLLFALSGGIATVYMIFHFIFEDLLR